MIDNSENSDTEALNKSGRAIRARRSCLEHAEDLLASAERVLKDNGFPNVAYHLAILALEEIGKAGMLASRAVVSSARDTDWMEKKFGNHVWKLQWAVWSPNLSTGRIDPKDFEEARSFAQSTHLRRLAGLYVNPDADDTTSLMPRDAVSLPQATSLLKLAHARLEMEKAGGDPDVGSNDEIRKWFLDTVNDDGGRRRIFSRPFIDKHAEFKGDTRAWVAWARQEFDKIAAEEQEQLRKELARPPSVPGKSKPKWMIRIRLYSPSHSIRPKVLKYWNERISWAKLIAVSGKRHEVFLELTLRDHIPLNDLFNAGRSFSARCIVALNIGSLGFFWFDLPRQTSRYFESIGDLDAKDMVLDVGRSPGLLGDWKQGALSERNLHHAIQCIAVFGPMSNAVAEPIFGPYVHGLTLLSKSDIHLSCEDLARDEFISTLRKASAHFGDWEGKDETFVSSMHTVFQETIPDREHRDQLFAILLPPHKTRDGSLSDAVSAKRLSDLYLVLVADRRWKELVKGAGVEGEMAST